MDSNIRPFDILSRSKGKEITVALKNGETYKGKLKAFDIHLNLVLFETNCVTSETEDQTDMVIRGDAITTIKNI